jgi:hypothetical protein
MTRPAKIVLSIVAGATLVVALIVFFLVGYSKTSLRRATDVEPSNATAGKDGRGAPTSGDADDSQNKGTGEGRASVTTGSIAGQVTDNTGAVMPGVSVTITGPVITGSQGAIVNGEGHYEFSEVPSGEYSIKFELPGFETVVREGIQVRSGHSVAVDIRLQVSKGERSK